MKVLDYFMEHYNKYSGSMTMYNWFQFAESYAEQQTKELKDLIQELSEYYPNTRGYDEVRKEILKRINKD